MQAVTPGVTHGARYHCPSDGHFFPIYQKIHRRSLQLLGRGTNSFPVFPITLLCLVLCSYMRMVLYKLVIMPAVWVRGILSLSPWPPSGNGQHPCGWGGGCGPQASSCLHSLILVERLPWVNFALCDVSLRCRGCPQWIGVQWAVRPCPSYVQSIHIHHLQVSTWPSSTKLATGSVLAVA